MSKDFAVVKIGGGQYKVSKGDKLAVDKQGGEKGDKLSFDNVFFTSKKGKFAIGTPCVKGAKIEVKILEQFRGKKIKILKFKAKSRYRRRMGHRQEYTRIEIVKI